MKYKIANEFKMKRLMVLNYFGVVAVLAMTLAACGSMEQVAQDMSEKESECNSRGGVLVLDQTTMTIRCSTQNQPSGGNWMTFHPAESKEIPYRSQIVFRAKGIDSALVTEWHLFDYHEGPREYGQEVSNSHFMIYGCEIRIIKQTYIPRLPEHHHGDSLCFNPSLEYEFTVDISQSNYRIRISEGSNPRVEMNGSWRTPFHMINSVRVGAGTFGSAYAAPNAIQIWVK